MASEVRLKVLELYQHPDPNVKQAADQALQQFQESEAAWAVAQELLGDGDTNVQFFAAQTVYNKVQQVSKGYKQVDGAALQGLVPLLQRHLLSQVLTQQAKQRLVLALAALAVHLCNTCWPGAVADILSLADAHPSWAWSALLAIPEQLSSVVHNYIKTNSRTVALLASSQALVAAALRCEPGTMGEEAVTETFRDSPFSLALQTLTQWSKVLGLQLLEHNGFATWLAALMGGPAGSSEPVLELLIEVLQSSPEAFAIYADLAQRQSQPQGRQKSAASAADLAGLVAAVVSTMGNLLPPLQRLSEGPPALLEDSDAARLSRWARVAAALVEAYTQILWVEQGAAQTVLAFLGACFQVHPHVAQCVFELWAVLKDTNRDGRLPPDALVNLLRSLAPSCCIALARFARLDTTQNAEDPAAAAHLREAIQDVIVDVVCISAETSEAHLILGLLCKNLEQCEASRDWHGVEVAWFAFSGIAEALADEPTVPAVYQNVVESILRAEVTTEDQCSTAAVLLRTLGPHFEGLLQPHLAGAVRWLVGRVRQVPSVAGEAVQEICGYAGQHLLPHVAEFLAVVEATAPAVSPAVDASLYGALVGIARNLPNQQLVEAFAQICRTTTAALAKGLDVASEEGRHILHRCTCRLLRCTIVMEMAGGDGNTPGVASATCLTQVLGVQWPSLAPPCRQLLCAAAVERDAPKGKPIFEYSDAALQVNILAVLRYAAKAANTPADLGGTMAAKLVELALACCQEGQLACLHAVSVLAAEPKHARAAVLPALDSFCQAALSHVSAGRPTDHLIPFLELAASLSASLGDEFFQSAQLQLPLLRQLCLEAMQTSDQDILRPTLLFVQKLLMSRLPELSGRAEVIQGVLLSFHRWPRSMGGHCFKVFSASIERHETIFLPLAMSSEVPAVAGLPPAEQDIARRGLREIRGPRLKALLGDLGAIARGENTVEVLQLYAA